MNPFKLSRLLGLLLLLPLTVNLLPAQAQSEEIDPAEFPYEREDFFPGLENSEVEPDEDSNLTPVEDSTAESTSETTSVDESITVDSPDSTLEDGPTETAEPSSIQAKANEFIDSLDDGDYQAAYELLHPGIQDDFPVERLETAWRNILDRSGDFLRRGDSRVVESVTGQFVTVSMEFANGTDDFLVIFDDEERIIGVDYPQTRDIDDIANLVVDALIEDDYSTVRAYLHPFLKTGIFSAEVKEKWTRLLQENGDVKQRVDTRLRRGSTFDNTDVVSVKIEFDHVIEDLLIIFDRDRKITGIDFPLQN